MRWSRLSSLSESLTWIIDSSLVQHSFCKLRIRVRIVTDREAKLQACGWSFQQGMTGSGQRGSCKTKKSPNAILPASGLFFLSFQTYLTLCSRVKFARPPAMSRLRPQSEGSLGRGFSVFLGLRAARNQSPETRGFFSSLQKTAASRLAP